MISERPHRRWRSRAFVLPTLLLVTVVLLMVATMLLASGTSSLRVATHDQQTNQALYAAEAGLAIAAEVLAENGKIEPEYNGTIGDCEFIVRSYRNDGGGTIVGPDGVRIPPSTLYLRSEGISANETRRFSGALFTIGLRAFKVGALGDKLTVTNSTFDSYKSAEGDYDPTSTDEDVPLLASNASSGETFTFKDSQIKGDIFVGPGGSPSTQISAEGSTIGKTQAMADAIKLDGIELPEPPDNDDEVGIEDYDIPPLGDIQLVGVEDGNLTFDDGHGMRFTVDRTKINPQDADQAIAGSNGTSDGPPGGPYVRGVHIAVSTNHQLFIYEDGSAYYMRGGSNVSVSPQASSLGRILFGLDSLPEHAQNQPANVTNPSTLQPGFYEKVTIDAGNLSALAGDGKYIIDELVITDGGKLTLPEGASQATIYVKNKITIRGEDALGNATKKPPLMKVYYLGEDDVELSGGSESYFTLVAEKAIVNLTSPFGTQKTEFFGALVGREVSVTNANFHFDTSTSGIGTGTMGSAMTVLHRHRL